MEAAVRAGHGGEAEPYVATLEAMGDANGSRWTTGVAARSRALITGDDHAEPHYRQAVDLLGRAGTEVELARAHLLYGEWLRRRRRRRDARLHLRSAMEMLERAGAGPFAQRARAELEATGAQVDLETAGGGIELTSQEQSVASLAARGHTNAEIGSTLFISANTVDYHLRKVFQKFAISSRRQLSDRLSDRLSDSAQRLGLATATTQQTWSAGSDRRCNLGSSFAPGEDRTGRAACRSSPSTTEHRSSTRTGGPTARRSC